MVPDGSPQWRESHQPWVCFSCLYGDSHLLEQKQAILRQEPTWKAIYFAEKFIEFLLRSISQPVAKKDPFHLPKYIIYQLKRLQNQVKHRSGEVQGSAGFGLRAPQLRLTAMASPRRPQKLNSQQAVWSARGSVCLYMHFSERRHSFIQQTFIVQLCARHCFRCAQ